MANLTLRNTKGSPLTNNEIDANFTNLNIEVGQKLDAADYTAEDVLLKVLTVHGQGSLLDADLLDGKTTASTNTINTVVTRDSSGNFAANAITATLIGNVNGNADTVTNGVYTSASYSNPAWLTSLAGSKVTSIPNSSLLNNTVTINGTAVELGGSISISGSSNTWTAQQTFRDSLFTITDELDTSKTLKFQLSNISSGTQQVLIVPNETGIIATQSYTMASSSATEALASPPAAIAYFARSTAPSGWLKANGAAVSRSAYANLFAAIGTSYGAGDGSTTFNVPDLRGEFLRSWDDGRGLDVNRGFGSIQEQDWKSFWLTDTGQNTYTYNHGPVHMGKSQSGFIGNLFTGYWRAPAAAIGLQWDGSENRPRNIALLVCIKY